MNSSINDLRRRELAKIHLAAEQLGFNTKDRDERSEYRSMLWTVARVRSAADLDQAGRRCVLDHLKKLGFRPRHGERSFGRPHNANSEERGPQIHKIEALLAAAGRPWAYADGMAARMYKVSRTAFCNPKQLQGLIAALVYDAKRHGRRT